MKKVILHHTVTGHNVHTKTIKSWGYDFVLRWNSDIVKARGNAHTYGHNDWTGISLVGNFEKEHPNPRQIKALIKFFRKHNVKTIKGHKDFRNNPPGHNYTACPGRHLYKKLPYIRKQIKKKRRNVKLYKKKNKNTVYLKDGNKGYPIKSATAFNKWFGKDAWNYVKKVKNLPFKVDSGFRIYTPKQMEKRFEDIKKDHKKTVEEYKKLEERAETLENNYELQDKELEKLEKGYESRGKKIEKLKAQEDEEEEERQVEKKGFLHSFAEWIVNLFKNN